MSELGLKGWEAIALWSAVSGYALACVVALVSLALKRQPEKTLLTLLCLTTLLHTLAIAMRWTRIGHVPVGSMHEMLSANVWGLMMALTLAYALLPKVRAAAALGLPVVVILMGWMLLRPAEDSMLPRTYNTVWLFIHIGFIKVFLGTTFVALGQSIVILLRKTAWGADRFSRLPSDINLAELSFRLIAVGWIFDSLGIIAGAIWANDAWGRYWSWDPLETWSLLTWLSIGITVHTRSAYKVSPNTHAWLIVSVFVIAFLTFFGIPFVSAGLHKGAI